MKGGELGGGGKWGSEASEAIETGTEAQAGGDRLFARNGSASAGIPPHPANIIRHLHRATGRQVSGQTTPSGLSLANKLSCQHLAKQLHFNCSKIFHSTLSAHRSAVPRAVLNHVHSSRYHNLPIEFFYSQQHHLLLEALRPVSMLDPPRFESSITAKSAEHRC
jgi:hypothetical protein